MSSIAAAASGEIPKALDYGIVRFLLGLTVFCGGFVFIEPSPYELSFLAFFGVALIAGLRLAPLIAIQIMCLVAFNIGGLIALSLLGLDTKTVTYTAVSFYLALTAIAFACVIGSDADRATRIIGRAWIASAVIVAATGIVGYFQLVPGAEFFTRYGRAKGTFEDPNVYGPFLIMPALLLTQGILNPGRRSIVLLAAPLGVILVGLLLCFSRAAWAHLVASGACLVYLSFLISESNVFRLRVIAMTLIAAAAAVALLASLLSIPSVWEFFEMRAALMQDYDSGATGRFGTQLAALPLLLETPFGLGPFEYSNRFGLAPHNIYINAFAAYGWLGGISYLTFVALTLMLGVRYVFAKVPWQHFHIAALSTFIGLAMVGMVVDTDHWRHFYLIAGMIWGTSAATWALSNSHPIDRFVERRRDPMPAG